DPSVQIRPVILDSKQKRMQEPRSHEIDRKSSDRPHNSAPSQHTDSGAWCCAQHYTEWHLYGCTLREVKLEYSGGVVFKRLFFQGGNAGDSQLFDREPVATCPVLVTVKCQACELIANNAGREIILSACETGISEIYDEKRLNLRMGSNHLDKGPSKGASRAFVFSDAHSKTRPKSMVMIHRNERSPFPGMHIQSKSLNDCLIMCSLDLEEFLKSLVVTALGLSATVNLMTSDW
ncbi:MAG: hypothetical protein Q9192_006565, partial [Flavoplaca navasiana]